MLLFVATDTDVAAVNPVPTRRVFKAWEEAWEKRDFKAKTDTAREDFEIKHKNLVWLDVDEEDSPQLEHVEIRWVDLRSKRDSGWHVIGRNTVTNKEDEWRSSAVIQAVQCQETGLNFRGDACQTLKQPEENGIRVVLEHEVRTTEEDSNE